MKSLRNIHTFFATHPLTRDAQLASWARFAAWQVRSRFSSEVTVPWIEGTRLAIRRGMVGATGNIYAGLHEFEDMMVLLHFLREDDLFLDIGANVGSFAVLGSGICRARSWAFEPDPKTVSHLERNIAVNDLGALVKVYALALGERDGEAAFTVGLDSTNQIIANKADGSRIVRMARLDTLVGAARPTMIKMDVEGYEEQVVAGASETLQQASLKVIELETTSPRIVDILRQLDFTQAFYDPFGRRLSRRPVSATAQNSLYIRDWSFVEDRLLSARQVQVLGRSV